MFGTVGMYRSRLNSMPLLVGTRVQSIRHAPQIEKPIPAVPHGE